MRIAIGLGSNLGPRRARLELTLRQLDATPGLAVLRASSWYRTPPLRGGTARGWFLNGVALVESALEPPAVLARCQALERLAGRRRGRYWGDRPLDLDVLLVDGVVSRDPELVLPHPGIASRSFVMLPLLEVWSDARDPRTDTPLSALPEPSPPRPARVGVPPRRIQPSRLPRG